MKLNGELLDIWHIQKLEKITTKVFVNESTIPKKILDDEKVLLHRTHEIPSESPFSFNSFKIYII